MSRRELVLSAGAAAFLTDGGRDLPLAKLGTRPASLEAGRPVDLLDPAGGALGTAVADPDNGLLRLLVGRAEPFAALDPAFFAARVDRAVALRRDLGLLGERAACRLIHGAGDGLPGFAVDRLGPFAVAYVYARALLPLGHLLARALIGRADVRGVVVKVRARGAAAGGAVRQEIVGEAPPAALVVEEEGVPFEVHPIGGLNFGLFTDMREHRHRLARHAAGRAVWNGFSYTGSLSVVAARAGATQVTSVDLSAGVGAWAQDNFRLSGLDPAAPAHRFEVDDVGRALDRRAREGPPLDLILLDPPTFSAARGAPWSLERDYPELVARACAPTVLRPDGVLWLASNTRAISLERIAAGGLRRAGREAQLLEVGGLPPDHPTVPAQPDDRYLQVCVFRVA